MKMSSAPEAEDMSSMLVLSKALKSAGIVLLTVLSCFLFEGSEGAERKMADDEGKMEGH